VTATPAITSVSVLCSPAPILTTQTSSCTATVQGTGAFSSAVIWAATDGTINSSGVFTPTAAGSATITATSTQDATKSGSAPVTVTATPAITSVSVLCSPAPILTTQTSTCTATVQGTGAFSSAVTWAATDGTINSSGVFTPTAAGSATITATSTQDATKSGSAPVTVNSAVTEGSCSITATGTIQADGSLGGNPLLGDVYQIQGTTPSEHYVDDDEANNGTVTFTSPGGTNSVTVGMFLLSESTNGVNTYAVRWAAGDEGKANGSAWLPGTWTWSMNYTDHQSTPYTCTATGSVTVASTWNAGNGFLRNHNNTPNLVTDGNNQLFFPIGFDWYDPYYNGTNLIWEEAEIPALAYVTVSGTSVTYSSGVQFSTSAEPSNITSNIYLCPSLPVCTPYFNITINSATSITLPSSGGTYSTPIPAYLGFTRDIGMSLDHASGAYETTLANAAQFYARWGETFNRLAMNNEGAPTLVTGSGNFLGTGYNGYNWSASGSEPWGIPAIDAWFAAGHAYGIHFMLGGPNNVQPCASYSCTSTTLSNLQNLYAYESARWGAFYDALELENEQSNVPQTWVDDIGTVLTNGVSGIAGGNPADPYQHFFTNSFFPNNPIYYSTTYAPIAMGGTDAYLNLVDLPHVDGPLPAPVYEWLSGNAGMTSRCPGNGSGGLGGNTLPRFNGEQGQQLGIAPSSQSASTLNNETNGPRIVTEQLIFNQCGGAVFNAPGDFFGINSTTPIVTNTWYDFNSVPLLNFMTGLDPAAAPISMTLSGGCASNACSYAALGSSTHVRAVLVSATGNSSTGVSNAVTNPTITLTVPAGTYKWVNPATGAILASGTTTSGSNSFTYSGTFAGESNPTDIYFQADQP